MTSALRSQRTRHAIAASVLALYLAGSIELVHSLGRNHRARLVAAKPPAVVPDLAPRLADVPPPPVAPAVVPSELVQPSDPVVVESPSPSLTPGPAPIPVPVPVPVSNAAVAEVVLDPFWDRPEQRKVWDLMHVTLADERQIGAALHQAIGTMHQPILNGDGADRLQIAAEPFLKARTRQDVEYTFTVLDCPEVNAFSHPGGFIYVCRGLFDKIPADDDQTLEFLVGHEIAHVDQGHAIICLRDPALPREMGTSLLYSSFILPLAYTKRQELDADLWTAQTMIKTERSERATLMFLRMLASHAKAQGYGNQRMRPGSNPPVAPIDNHLRAHVPPRERLKALQDRLWPATLAPK